MKDDVWGDIYRALEREERKVRQRSERLQLPKEMHGVWGAAFLWNAGGFAFNAMLVWGL